MAGAKLSSAGRTKKKGKKKTDEYIELVNKPTRKGYLTSWTRSSRPN